ncbi:hypothetical protein [Klebsiella pneumoniae]|uniref:hypothetical protein n=1 Tax=Klebsiella pneumoniae TaxID=573 RepID=UPI0030B754D7
MTDITELAQREKFEAWLSEKPLHARYMHWSNTLNAYDYTGIQLAWEAYQAGGAELVEALERAQQVEEELCKLLPPGAEYMDPPDGGDVTPLEGVRRMVADYRQRITELESRTVKIVDCDFGAVQHMSGGSTDYCHGFVDGTQNAIRSIIAAGIKVEAE